jgi:hypothetical protein
MKLNYQEIKSFGLLSSSPRIRARARTQPRLGVGPAQYLVPAVSWETPLRRDLVFWHHVSGTMFRRVFSSRYLRPNNALIDLLNHRTFYVLLLFLFLTPLVDKHLEQASPVRNTFKIRAFQAAIDAITQLDYPIKFIDDAKKVEIVQNLFSVFLTRFHS